jgi:hypothetical protein
MVSQPLEPRGSRKHDRAARHRKVSGAVSLAGNFSSRRPMCVRLCDGFFFPASVPAGGAESEEAACSGLCPDAPTEVYYQPNGSDKIEDAFSASGKSYSSLPIALRYRAVQDNTCTCHRSLADNFDPLRDATFRKGDALMTPRGFQVFKGSEKATHTPRDFTALSASPLPRAQRATLEALERVSMAPQRGAGRSGVVAAFATSPASLAGDATKIRLATRAPSTN